MSLRTYDITKLSVTLDGVPLDAFAAEGVTIEFEGDDWTEVTDTAGNVTRSRTPQGVSTATINVIPGSPASSVLNTFRNNDQKTGRGAFRFWLKDYASGTEVSAERAYIRTPPALSFASEASAEAWVLVLVKPREVRRAIPLS